MTTNTKSLTLPIAAGLPRSTHEVAEYLGLPVTFSGLTNVPENFLPGEPHTFYSAMRYICDQMNWDPSSSTIDRLDAFMQDDYYLSYQKQIFEQEAATDEHVIKVVRTIALTTTLQKNIVPEILMEVFVEIIQEIGPSSLALELTRKLLRNEMVYTPSPKEFRDALLRVIKSLNLMACEMERLPLYRDDAVKKINERLALKEEIQRCRAESSL